MKFNKILRQIIYLTGIFSLLWSSNLYPKTKTESAYPQTPPMSEAIGQSDREQKDQPAIPRRKRLGCFSPVFLPSETRDVLIDDTGNIYLIREERILKINQANGSFVKIVGGDSNQKDGIGDDAGFKGLRKLDYDASKNLYSVEDPLVLNPKSKSVNLIRKIDQKKEEAITLAGSKVGKATKTKIIQTPLNGLMDILVDNKGNIYVSEFGPSKIKKISGKSISVYAGQNGPGYKNGTLSEAQFHGIDLLAKDEHGNLYVSDYFNSAIRKIDSKGNVSTLVSDVFNKTDQNSAQRNKITSMKADRHDQLYFTTLQSQKIWKVSANGSVTPFIGQERKGDHEGMCEEAELINPRVVKADPEKDLLYIVSNSKLKTVRSYEDSNSCEVASLELRSPCLGTNIVTPITPGI